MAVLPTPAPPMMTGLSFVRPRQGLHHAPDLLRAADDRIQLPLSRQARQVYGVAFQRLVAALGARVRNAMPAAHLLKRLVRLLYIDAVCCHDPPGIALAIHESGKEQMLRADVIVLEAHGLIFRCLQKSH